MTDKPTISQVLGGIMQHAIDNPKSSIQSLLTVLLTIVPILLTSGVIHGAGATIAASVLSVAKLYLGAIEKDAGTIPAYVPGEGIKPVESHELPNDPSLTPKV